MDPGSIVLCTTSFLFVCVLRPCKIKEWTKIEDFSSAVYLSVDFVILSVCLSICLYKSPPGHNFKPIIKKLYHAVEVVTTEKPIYFEVKGYTGR